MAKTGRIQYLHDETTHAELILCEHSSISYPTHSHVSVLTAGMVLEGGIILTDRDGPRLCQEGAVFGILPYTPHSIRADGPYTLLSLCIQSQGLPPSGTGLAPPLPDMLVLLCRDNRQNQKEWCPFRTPPLTRSILMQPSGAPCVPDGFVFRNRRTRQTAYAGSPAQPSAQPPKQPASTGHSHW